MDDESKIVQIAAKLVAGDLSGNTEGNGSGSFRYFEGNTKQDGKLNAIKAIDDAWLLLQETRERTSQKILGQFKPKFKPKKL